MLWNRNRNPDSVFWLDPGFFLLRPRSETPDSDTKSTLDLLAVNSFVEKNVIASDP